ncbi:MAG: NAD(P)/FAD-dependent oxidoreductase [Nitrospirota bacterium]
MHDVIVIGAGPIGSYTAYLLAREGLNVGVFERNPVIGGNVNCTGIVSTECFKKFDLPGETILRKVDSIKAFSPSGNYVRYRSASPLAYVVNRTLLDQEINRRAMKEGANVYLNTSVEEITITDSSFKVRVRKEGEEKEACSIMGVIATGLDLNLPKGGFIRPQNFLYGVQTEVEIEDVSEIEVHFGKKIAPGSFAWVVPINGKSAKIGLITKKNPAAFLKGFLRNLLMTHRIKDNNQIRCSPIPLGSIPKSYAERLIVVGEAAGQVKTTTGGGIYFGLLCSEIAASTIIEAFNRRDFSEKVFEEYEINWRSEIEHELEAGILLRKLFSRLSDHHINFLIDLARKDGILPIIEKAKFDWHRDIITSLLQHVFFKRHFKK